MRRPLEGGVVRAVLAAALLATSGTAMRGETGCFESTGPAPRSDHAVPLSRPLPLVFEPNLGQTDSEARFLARVGDHTLLLTEQGAIIAQPGTRPVRMNLVGAIKPDAIEGLEPTGGISNYFLGQDTRKWRTGIKHYKRVRYRRVYAGIDLVYYGNPDSLEYDFLVQPGADPGAIQLAFEGVESLAIDDLGNLLLSTPVGQLTQLRPKVYQQHGGQRIDVAARYLGKSDLQVGIEVGDYNRSLPLVIDPILVYSTYLGGSQNEIAHGVVVDIGGNAYVIGQTCSTNFPTNAPLQPTNAGVCDVFLTKINAAGSALVYSTYLGGSSTDEGRGIAVDSTGNVYLAGQTCSSDFPTLNPIRGYRGACDAFVAKLDPTASALVYSTYLGGSGLDRAYRLTIDASGDAYVVGQTASTNFPTASPLQPAFAGGVYDAFVTKLNATGSSLIYSTYLGGAGKDYGFGIAVDAAGNTLVTGRTASSNFPILNALQGSNRGLYDAFVAKIEPQGTAFVYSTYMGGQLWDAGLSITTDASGTTYLSGYAESPDFPTANAFQPVHGGDRDAIVAQISPSGTLLFSSYLGGSGRDMGDGLGIDASGNMYVTGVTSGDFPTLDPIQASFGGGLRDVFVTKVTAGLTISYSTYLGGSGDEEALSISVDSNGGAYVTGYTQSVNFPRVNALQRGLRGNQDAFVVSIN